ncbi:hypothetical protein MIR68_002712 [Amoeboaphelidium protococcarum]|nr:hypothetical protein MIR68_002712 [Amoeboaphelidium protococcarum]
MAPGPAATTFSNGPNIKLGAMKKKCNGGFTKWGLRYLILDKVGRVLHYYHTPKDQSPRRSLDLTVCVISRLTPEESPKDPGFKITIPNVRELIFVGTNAAVVDDWINALFQAKAPSQPVAAQSYGGNSQGTNVQKAPTDQFSYNGPTLAVLPGRNQMGQMMQQDPAAMQQQQQQQQLQQQQMMQQQQQQQQAQSQTRQAPAMMNQAMNPMQQNMQQQARMPQPQVSSARSTQSTFTDGQSANNTTLVAGQGDTNSTLVAGGGGGGNKKVPSNQPVTFIIMTPDNKKFSPIEKPVVSILKIGRFVGSAPQSDEMITFKSKVISRNHAEIWSVNGEVYIRDTRSQSGTFLNAMRLSEPGKESKPYRLKPGDVIQFGVDYKGATEDNARCISVRIDLKSRMVEQPDGMMGGMGGGMKSQQGEETLIGGGANNGGSTDATLVGAGARGTKMSDKTIVGDANQDSTFYNPAPGMMPNNGMQQQQQMMQQQQQQQMMTGQMMMPPGQTGVMMGPGMIARPGVTMLARPPMNQF